MASLVFRLACAFKICSICKRDKPLQLIKRSRCKATGQSTTSTRSTSSTCWVSTSKGILSIHIGFFIALVLASMISRMAGCNMASKRSRCSEFAKMCSRSLVRFSLPSVPIIILPKISIMRLRAGCPGATI